MQCRSLLGNITWGTSARAESGKTRFQSTSKALSLQHLQAPLFNGLDEAGPTVRTHPTQRVCLEGHYRVRPWIAS